MRARLWSLCRGCGQDIKAGQEIVRERRGGWVHRECSQGYRDIQAAQDAKWWHERRSERAAPRVPGRR